MTLSFLHGKPTNLFSRFTIGALTLSSMAASAADAGSFADDLSFLSEHTDVLVLQNDSGAAIAVAPDWQARVVTSTWDSEQGASMGWLNRPVIEQGVLDDEARKGTNVEKIHAFGGEERFWIGPEAGQFGYYFAPGAEFTIDNWFTPHAIDTEEYDVDLLQNNTLTFSHTAHLTNHQGTLFNIGINRQVQLLDQDAYVSIFELSDSFGVQSVGYSTTNTIQNQGDFTWDKETGMPSVWILGMYPASDTNLVYIPTKGEQLPAVNDSYFGKVSSDDLKVAKNGLTMVAHANKRIKIGIKEQDSLGLAAAYNSAQGTLTIIKYLPQEAPAGYVNSLWKKQDAPFSGDVINAYNDGPATPGSGQLGKFFELESSSPAANLKAGDSLTHKQYTFHFHGEKSQLNKLSQTLLGVELQQLENTF